MKKILQTLFTILLIFMVLFTNVNTISADDFSGSSIDNSTGNGSSGKYQKCGLRVTPGGSLVGYRLSVVQTDDNGKYKKVLVQKDYTYASKDNWHINGGDSNFYVNVGKTNDKKYCKTRFGVVNEGDGCVKWDKMNGKDYYNSTEKKIPTVKIDNKNKKVLNTNYDWSLVDYYYSEKAKSPKKTAKLLESLGVDKDLFVNYDHVTVCADGSTNKTGQCKEVTGCDESKLPAQYKNYDVYYDGNVKKCVSTAGAPTATSNQTFSHYTCEDYPGYELSGAQCLGPKTCSVGTWLEGDSCTSCAEYPAGTPRSKYKYYAHGGLLYQLDGNLLTNSQGQAIGSASFKEGYCYSSSGEAKTKDDKGKAQYVSAATRDVKNARAVYTTTYTYSCPNGFYDDEAHGNCRFVHGDYTYGFADGTKYKQTGVADITSTKTVKENQVCSDTTSMKGRIWIIIEPMFTIATQCRGAQKTYFGTATELGKLVHDNDGSDGSKSGDFKVLANSDYYKTTAAYLTMPENSFKDRNTTHTFKPIKGIGNGKVSSGQYTGGASELYNKKSGKVMGVGSGIVIFSTFSGESYQNDCEDESKTCPDKPEISIASCYKTYTSSPYNFSESAATNLCIYKECKTDSDIECKKCNDEGREEPKILTHDDIVDELVEKLKSNQSLNVTTTAQQIKDNFIPENCTSEVWDYNNTNNKFTCENVYTNKKKIEIKMNKTNTTTTACTTAIKNKYGKYVTDFGNCSIYCEETADLVFPGDVKDQLRASDSFEWPSKSSADYPLTIDYSVTCTAVNNTGAPGSSCDRVIDKETFSNDIETKISNTIKLTYKNDSVKPNYNLNSLELKRNNLENKKYSFSKDKGNSYGDITSADLYDGNKIKLTASYRYNLPTELNYYQDEALDYYNLGQEDKAFGKTSFTGNGRLATERIANGTQRYEKYYKDALQLDVAFGINNSVGSIITDYKCDYSVYQNPETGDCVCPEDSLHPGESLKTLESCIHEDSIDKYCATDIGKYCNTVWTAEIFKNCKCENCEQKVDFSECVTEKKGSYDSCRREACSKKPECKNECYDNKYKYCRMDNGERIGVNEVKYTNWCYPSQEDMDNENTKTRKECGTKIDKDPCPDCPKNEKLITYRTIDVENPFPGKGGNGVTTAFSLNNTKGRYPGKNWDSVEWVKNKITNVKIIDKAGPKTYKGNEIYNRETPLYTITLTPDSIRKIRNELNKKYEYSDYSILSCAKKNSDDKCLNYYNQNLRNIVSIAGECGKVSSSEISDCYKYKSSTGNTYHEGN